VLVLDADFEGFGDCRQYCYNKQYCLFRQ
jgi:hypothetical protein